MQPTSAPNTVSEHLSGRERPSSTPTRKRAPIALIASMFALVALGLFAWHPLARLELLGRDAFATVALGWRDVDLVRGTWRPLEALTFALDRRLWGIEAFWFHVGALLVFVAVVASSFCATIALLGRGAWLGATIAGMLVALHPIVAETIVMPERRGDLLATAFTLAALIAAAGAGASASNARRWIAAACCAAAVASSEAGMLASIAVATVAWTGSRSSSSGSSPASSTSNRARGALAIALPSLVAAFVVIAWRALSLPEGVSTIAPSDAFSRFPQALSRSVGALIPSPDPRLDAIDAARIAAFAWIALVGGLVYGGLASKRGELGERGPLTVVSIWSLAALLFAGARNGEIESSALLVLAPFAVALGALAEHARAIARERSALGGASLFGLAVLVLGLGGRHSAPVSGLPDHLARASRSTVDFLADVDVALQLARPGRRVEVVRPASEPVARGVAGADPSGRAIEIADARSMRARLGLLHPGVAIAVLDASDRPPEPAPDEYQIVLTTPATDVGPPEPSR